MSQTQQLLFVIGLSAAILIAGVQAGVLWRRRAWVGAKSFLAVVSGCGIWALGDALQLFFPGFPWVVLSYVGIGLLPLAWLAFCLEYSGRGAWLTTPRLLLLAVIPVATVPIVATNEAHYWMWENLARGGRVEVHYGFWHALSSAFGYALCFAGYFFLFLNLAEGSRVHRRQLLVLLLAGAVPWIANFLQILDVYPRSAPNPTPLAFTLSSVVFFWGLFRLQLLQIVPVAQRAVTNQMREGLILLEANDRLVQVNPAAERWLGISDTQVSGLPVTEVLRDWPALLALPAAQDPPAVEVTRELPGTTLRLEVKLTVLRDAQGRKLGCFFFLRDITEAKLATLERERLLAELQQANAALRQEIVQRHKTEAELQQSEESHRTFCENSVMGIYRTTPDGRILMANPALLRMLGFDSFEELSRRRLEQEGYEPNYQRRHFRESLERHGEIVGLEARWLRRDGTFLWIREHARVVRDAQGRALHYDGTVEDISALKAAEAKRLQLELQMQALQKIESLGELAGGVAHDFNNALTAILGNAHLVLEDLPPNSPTRELVAEICQNSRRAADLCQQMLAYSGRTRMVMEPVQVRELLSGVERLLPAIVARKPRFTVEVEPELPAIHGDVAQLRQLLSHLIHNAAEALAEREGEIRVTAGVRHCSVADLRDAYVDDRLPEGLYVWLEVTDTGSGMDATTLCRAFEPFFTTKFLGRGLGLSAVLGIVRSHHAAVRIQSQLGKGTTVRVLFPVRPVLQTGSTTQVYRATALPLVRPRVLLVDDESSVRAVGRKMIERRGFQVVEATNGHEALEIYRAQRENIAVVMLDLVMPGLNGEETFRELRLLNPQVRVLFASGHSPADLSHRFIGEQLIGFVPKPYSGDELWRRVEALLR